MLITKSCSTCNTIKNISKFGKRKTSKDGLRCQCRECENEYAKKRRRTKEGLLLTIYSHQIEHSKTRGHNFPTYTKQELKDWLFTHVLFEDLYFKWVESDYDKYLIPSIDRINDYLPYTFDNIQLMTWGENDKKGIRDMKNGVNNKQNISVHQINTEGEVINTYYSMNQAERETSIQQSNISEVCSGRRNIAGGFRWEYA